MRTAFAHLGRIPLVARRTRWDLRARTGARDEERLGCRVRRARVLAGLAPDEELGDPFER
jgi:hypothetical protein